MKTNNSQLSNLQPWRITFRHKETLQEFQVLAFGSTSDRALVHAEEFFSSLDYDPVNIFAIKSNRCVMVGLFSDKYANPLISLL